VDDVIVVGIAERTIMANISNPVQQLLNAEKKAAVLVNDAKARKWKGTTVALRHDSLTNHNLKT